MYLQTLFAAEPPPNYGIRMDSDSDSEQELADLTTSEELDSIITEEDAKHNYEEAGRLVPEENDPISIAKHEEIMDASLLEVLDEVLHDLALPYEITDFQKLSINTLLQKKDLILLSPTGSGKES